MESYDSTSIGTVLVNPALMFNSSTTVLVGIFGTDKGTLGSFGRWMAALIFFEEEESVRGEACREAIWLRLYVVIFFGGWEVENGGR